MEAPTSSDEDADTEEEETSCAADEGSDVGEALSSKADAATDGGTEKQSSHFPQFDVVHSPSDHHFLGSKEQQIHACRPLSEFIYIHVTHDIFH